MKKKLFENIGGNMFKVVSETESPHFPIEKYEDNPTSDYLDGLLGDLDPKTYEAADVHNILAKYFDKAGKDRRSIELAKTTLEEKGLDSGLVGEFLQSSHPNYDRYPDDDQS